MDAMPSPAGSSTGDPVVSATVAQSDSSNRLGSAPVETAAGAQGFLPAAARFLSRSVYVSCYYTSYGVTFPAALLVNVIPGGIPFASGLADGARAARDYVQGMHSQSARHRQILDVPAEEVLAATRVR